MTHMVDSDTDNGQEPVTFKPVTIELADAEITIRVMINPPPHAWDDPHPEQTEHGVEFTYSREESGAVTRQATFAGQRNPEGIEVGALRNIAWTLWERVAFTHAQFSVQFSEQNKKERTLAVDALRRQLGTAEPGRPGRKGHHPHHYLNIAASYRDLVSQGEPHPIAKIALQRNVSRNTASGWVREARKRGYLPPGHQGKAG